MSFEAFQASSQKTALTLLKDAPALIQSLQKQYSLHYPESSLSTVCASWGNDESTLLNNATVAGAVRTTLDVADNILTSLSKMEAYITLTIPKMEDGNNFGVTVQLAAMKHLQDEQEKLSKLVDDVLKYTSSRADALEKCKLPSETVTKTSTSSESNAAETDKEKGETATSNKSTSTEEKKTQTTAAPPEAQLRKEAVLAVDVNYYVKSKKLYQAALLALMAAVDFMEKNAEKIAEPKGSRGSGGHFSSMY